MKIDYKHSPYTHTLAGAKAALLHVMGDRSPKSLLDVGCGTGTWVRAAMDCGISDVFGIDGIYIPEGDLLFPRNVFRQQDLAQPWDLGRRFDIALCLEVGEHLTAVSAVTLVQSIVAHSDVVVFSAACPGQRGQHHVNCQWPEYWQGLFNAEGYVCDDSIRWKIWELDSVEAWYRQNSFVATRATDRAGKESRIKPVIHPQMLAIKGFDIFSEEQRLYFAQIESGAQPLLWYLTTPIVACAAKLKRKLGM
jgi:hypothetical protein